MDDRHLFDFEPDSRGLDVSKEFLAEIVCHNYDGRFEKFRLSVADLLDPSKLSKLRWIPRDTSDGWNWIHLPAINKLWVKVIMQTLLQMGSIRRDKKRLNDFLSASYQTPVNSAWSDGGRWLAYRRDGRQKEPSDWLLSLAIPYFDSESDAYLQRAHSSLGSMDQNGDSFTKINKLEEVYGVSKDAASLGLEPSCSLDKYFYSSLEDIDARQWVGLEKDQVVFRYFREKGAKSQVQGRKQDTEFPEARILMVSQLRLWKIGNFLITAAPSHWTRPRIEFWKYLIQALLPSIPLLNTEELLTRDIFCIPLSEPIPLVYLTMHIAHQCLSTLEEPYMANLGDSLTRIFEHEIAINAYKQLVLSNQVSEIIADSNGSCDSEKRRDIIAKEVDCYRVVMDIRDELSMISAVGEVQREIAEPFPHIIEIAEGHLRMECERKLGELKSILRRWHSRVMAMDKRAEVVEKALGHLVDLQLKQSSLDEAYDTKRLANEADRRAKEADFQSTMLFVFTIVTVFFTPLSFTTAFFAIPSQDFPRSESGDNVNWTKGQIGGGLATSLVGILLPVAVGIWFYRYKKGRALSQGCLESWVTARKRQSRPPDVERPSIMLSKVYNRESWAKIPNSFSMDPR